jgi:hypothetical protein
MFIFGSRFKPEFEEKLGFEPRRIEEKKPISVALSAIKESTETKRTSRPAPIIREEGKHKLFGDVSVSSKFLRREANAYDLFATAGLEELSVVEIIDRGSLRQLIEHLKRTPKTDELGFGFRLAAKKGSIDIIEFLIREGDIDPTHIIEGLAIAAKFGKLDVVERLTSLFPFNSFAIGKALREATKSNKKECIDFLSAIFARFDEEYFRGKRIAP